MGPILQFGKGYGFLVHGKVLFIKDDIGGFDTDCDGFLDVICVMDVDIDIIINRVVT